MRNFRTKARGLAGVLSGKKAVACLFSVAVAAVIFGGITLTGNMEQPVEKMTVAQVLREAGDTFTANADPTKFTGSVSTRAKLMETDELPAVDAQQDEEEKETTIKVISKEEASDALSESEEIQALLKEDEEIVTESFLGASMRAASKLDTQSITTEEVIAYPVERRESSLLKPGEEQVIQNGVNGKREVTYQLRIVNGELRSKKVLEENVLQYPVPQIVLVGTKGKAVSSLQFDVALDENGVPTQYKEVLTNQVAAGYNAGSKATGASGQKLSAGYVAVHPGEIPYGTRLYITSADNSFVYGFAVAADTGLSLMNNQIDVDLYYDTYLESCLNGIRNVNIYILD